MSNPTLILAALQREVDYARVQHRHVWRIRVTEDAIPGSICTVPLGFSVRRVEIAVHPDDWDGREWDEFCGIPVVGAWR